MEAPFSTLGLWGDYENLTSLLDALPDYAAQLRIRD
jgi:hypothetical protein